MLLLLCGGRCGCGGGRCVVVVVVVVVVMTHEIQIQSSSLQVLIEQTRKLVVSPCHANPLPTFSRTSLQYPCPYIFARVAPGFDTIPLICLSFLSNKLCPTSLDGLVHPIHSRTSRRPRFLFAGRARTRIIPLLLLLLLFFFLLFFFFLFFFFLLFLLRFEESSDNELIPSSRDDIFRFFKKSEKS